MAIIHWLLVYDLKQGRLVSHQKFANARHAAAAYAHAEQEHFMDKDVEIVLVGADSLETIEQTHGSYFDDTLSSVARPYLTGV